ncbi:MAG: hypothetical protein K9H12_14565, partial [Bacteroidales bacterium]|nr:hypothetical protein [Bacteroidales bacterium]
MINEFNKILKYLLSILLFISVQVNGQSRFHKASIDWSNSELAENDSGNTGGLRFRNAVYPLVNSHIPYFYDKIKWDYSGDIFSISFFEIQSAEIEYKDFTTNIEDIDFKIHYEFSVEGGQRWLQYWFIPLKMDSDKNTVEKISSFIIEIKSESSEKIPIGLKKSVETSNSPLASGNWFKIGLTESGIHRINYSELVSLGITNPQNVRIYGYGGVQLSEDASTGTQDELKPVAIYMEKGVDGVFGSGDYILFYGRGVDEWRYNYSQGLYTYNKNVFSDYGYYFITSDMGEAVFPEIVSSAVGDPSYISEEYDILRAHEEDEINHLKSGKEWYGESFDLSTTRSFKFNLPGLKKDQNLSLQTQLLGRGHDSTYFNIFANNNLLDKTAIRKTDFSDYTATFAYTSAKTYSFKSLSENLDIKLQYIKSESTDAGWLDYLVVNGRAALSMKTDELLFSDKFSLNTAGSVQYKVSNTNSKTKVWNITDPFAIREIDENGTGGSIQFKADSSDLQYYIAFNTDGQFPSPLFTGDLFGKIPNQNLHNSGFPDLVIISPPEFMDAAETLANFRREFNELDVLITQPEIIYNEFSSGRP